ncbi:MAG: zf-HC2 domain-containing protein [Eubacterium sp.]|nr:zf-HC2 domain-containing protein [Eubacterium sp.]
MSQMTEKVYDQSQQIDHKEFLDMIPHYLADDLREKDLLLFLDHIKTCHSCYEELETAFMVDRTVRYLNDEMDDDAEDSYNLPAMMQEDIHRKTREVYARQNAARIFRIVLIITALFVLFALLDFFGIWSFTRII